ncbi:MAG: hypothetical protein ACLQU1_34360 [Bryobacteraceae bacterium]
MTWIDRLIRAAVRWRIADGRAGELVDAVGGAVLEWERAEHARLEQAVTRKRFWESIFTSPPDLGARIETREGEKRERLQ